MTVKKTLLLVFGSNMLFLAALSGIVTFSQPAHASPPAAPSLVGPFYVTFSGADFHSYKDPDFVITRSGYAVIRSSLFGIGMAGLHLPNGAVLTQIMNDSDTVSDGHPKVWVKACPIGSASCSDVGSADQSTAGRHQATGTLNNTAVDNSSNGYFVQLDLPDDSAFYYARIEYSVPAPLFLPSIMR